MFNFKDFVTFWIHIEFLTFYLNACTKNILTLALFSFAFRMRGVVAIVLYVLISRNKM